MRDIELATLMDCAYTRLARVDPIDQGKTPC
jgi:hypothetical protein